MWKPTGRVTSEDAAKISAGFFNGDRSVRCPSCESAEWKIADHYATMPALDRDGLPDLGAFYAFAMLVSPCGYAMFLDVTKLGIRPQGTDQILESEQ